MHAQKKHQQLTISLQIIPALNLTLVSMTRTFPIIGAFFSHSETQQIV